MVGGHSLPSVGILINVKPQVFRFIDQVVQELTKPDVCLLLKLSKQNSCAIISIKKW